MLLSVWHSALAAEYSVGWHVEHYTLFFQHLYHGCYPGLCVSLGLAWVVALMVTHVVAQVVACTLIQDMIHAGYALFTVVTALIPDFILLNYRGSWGENRCYLANRRT